MKIYLYGPGLGKYEEPLERFYIKALTSLGHTVAIDNAEDVGLSIVVKWHPCPWELPRPRVLIYSDLTRRFPKGYVMMKMHFDAVFLVHKETPLIDNNKVFYLPVAMDPDVHKPMKVEKTIPLLFIGTYREERAWIADLDVDGVKPEIYGNGWEEAGVKTRDVYGEEKAKLYSSAKIVLNSHYTGETENMRLHEAMGYRCFQLTDTPGPYLPIRDLDTYHTKEQVPRLVRKHLQDNRMREYIALNGHAKALLRHTYKHRMETLLETVSKTLRQEATCR